MQTGAPLDASQDTSQDSSTTDADAAPGKDGPSKADGPAKPDKSIARPDGPITKPDGPIKIDSKLPDISITPDAQQCPPPVGCYYYKLVGSGCIKTPSPSGTKCDDKDKCTSPDKCDGKGVCVGTPIWCKMSSPTKQSLQGIWGSSSSNILAVGHNGTLVHFNGTKWSPQTPCHTSTQFRDIWGTSATNVYAVGAIGEIHHYNGAKWTCAGTSSGTQKHLKSVWGTSATSVYAVGDSGTILRFNGTKWSNESPNTAIDFYDVWASRLLSSENVIAVGTGGAVFQRTGTATWKKISPSGSTKTLWSVWGPLHSGFFTAGVSGTAFYVSGNTWNVMTANTIYSLYGLWGKSYTDVYAVGSYGTIRHYDGNKSYVWNTENSGTSDSLYAVWGSSSTNIFAVGYGGLILRYRPKP